MIVLLSETDRHPKIIKNGKKGVESAILHFAPATMSGYEVCPMRSRGCTKSCLNYAGFQYKRKYDARIARTKWFFEDRQAFLSQLEKEIGAVERRANRLGYQCGIRLNGTSDIRWEEIENTSRKNMMQLFPDIAFMDYTKHTDRKSLPKNYRLTFSRSEENHANCVEAINNGMNVSVVFHGDLPGTATLGGKVMQVIDGDEHDWRYGDYDDYSERVVVGLRAKGSQAKKDISGFVVNA